MTKKRRARAKLRRSGVWNQQLRDDTGITHATTVIGTLFEREHQVAWCSQMLWLSRSARDEFHRKRAAQGYSGVALLGDSMVMARATRAQVSCLHCLTSRQAQR